MKFHFGIKISSGIAVLCALCLAGNVQGIQIDKLIIVGTGNTQPPGEAAAPGDMPMGQDADGVSLLPEDAQMTEENLFGGQGGYVHAGLTLQEVYTDNLYNVDSDKNSSFYTAISPAVWFSLPRKKEIPVSIAPNNTSAGGLALQLKDNEGTDRYQAYALGGLDFEFYSEDEDLNTVNGLMEGLFRYNMRGGLSLQVVDRYTRDRDKYEVGSVIGVTEEIFDSNIALATADWNITEKLRAKFEYSNFWLDYEEDINAFQDRADNVLDLYAYFNYSVKTAFFLEGKIIDVQYDTATVNDNNQYFTYGGIKWYTTQKISLMAKAGWQRKEFDAEENAAGGMGDYDGLTLDVQASYKFTEKTSFSLDLYRANQETDSVLASDKTVLGATLGYKQKFTEKITGSLAFTYEDAEYTQLVLQDRSDTTFSVQPAAQYLFREWLMGEVAYQFEKRDSTDDLFDYQTNMVFANIKFAL